ncbi:MAG: hypothetical protein AAGH99_07855 [Planctomycetota bacterium]
METFSKTRIAYGRARCRGTAWIDSLIGLSLIVALTGALATAHTQHRKTAKETSSHRETVRELEVQAGRILAGQPIDAPDIELHPADLGWVKLVRVNEKGGETYLYVYLGPDASSQQAEATP